MKTLTLSTVLFVAACGYSATNNELVGQVKKVISKTPLICSNYAEVDISLGVMRNGVGSMSHEDMVLYVENSDDKRLLAAAADSGELVRLTYDTKRVALCVPDHQITHVEVLKDKSDVKVEAQKP